MMLPQVANCFIARGNAPASLHLLQTDDESIPRKPLDRQKNARGRSVSHTCTLGVAAALHHCLILKISLTKSLQSLPDSKLERCGLEEPCPHGYIHVRAFMRVWNGGHTNIPKSTRAHAWKRPSHRPPPLVIITHLSTRRLESSKNRRELQNPLEPQRVQTSLIEVGVVLQVNAWSPAPVPQTAESSPRRACLRV